MSLINTIKNDKENSIKFQLMNSYSRFRDIKKIKEIEGKRLIILFDCDFLISDIKTGKTICKIKGIYERERPRYYDNMFYDFIVLKNQDLILWSRGKIFYYKKSDNNYELSQIINEVKQQKNNARMCQIGYVEQYNLYNIIELENNVLISCNSIGIKIYNYKEKEYKLIKLIPMFLDIENIIKLKENDFLVIHHYVYYSGNCGPCTYHKIALSLFDSKSNQINKIFNHETPEIHGGRKDYMFTYFLIKENFIYQICEYPSDLEYYTKDNFSSDFNIYNIKTGNNILNLKISFRLICHFKDDLVFAQDYKNLYICKFENNIFASVYKFDFNNSNLCILKNNDLIIYEKKKIWKEYVRDDGTTYKDCIDSYNYYNHYKYLSI